MPAGINMQKMTHNNRKAKEGGCMNSRRQRLQIAVFLLLLVVFAAWYLMFYLPGRMAEPEGTLVCIPGRMKTI